MESLRKLKSLVFFELFQYIISPGIYVLCGGFFFLIGLIFIVGLDSHARISQNEFLMTQMLKCIWIQCIFIVPILTIRKIISEKHNGQLKQFLTIPIPNSLIIISKFISALVIFIILWSQVVILPLIAKIFIKDLQFCDVMPTLSCLLIVPLEALLIGSLTNSIGIFFGYLFDSYISAYVMYFICMFVFFMSGSLFQHFSLLMNTNCQLSNTYSSTLNVFYTIEDLVRLIIDSRILILYASISLVLLIFAYIVVKFKK